MKVRLGVTELWLFVRTDPREATNQDDEFVIEHEATCERVVIPLSLLDQMRQFPDTDQSEYQRIHGQAIMTKSACSDDGMIQLDIEDVVHETRRKE